MLLHGDCLKLLPSLEKHSVDMVLVDLPYGQTKMEWDKTIDLDQMWIELKRVCKPSANIIFFTTTKYGYEIIKSNEKWFRTDIVWEKNLTMGFMSANKSVLRLHEMIYLFGKPSGGGKTYNPQKTTGHKVLTYVAHEYPDGKPDHYGNTGRPQYNGDDTRFPTSIQKFNLDKVKLHKTQKPVSACEWLIKTYSNEGDTVLDFTMGSGSTGVACINTNREFIGIEMDEEIFKIAEKRLSDTSVNI